jgi:hypothetical protein
MSTTDTIQPWPDGGPDAYRCQSCGKAWEIDRDPEVDNESMMTERMAGHYCFPGVTIEQVDLVWSAAQEIARGLPDRDAERSIYPEEWTPEQRAAWSQEADRDNTAAEGLAVRFDCDLGLLTTATIDRAPSSSDKWKSLLWSAEVTARRAARTDEQRARNLAHMVAFGIPAGESFFHPRHARMAVEFLEEETARVSAEHPEHPATPIGAATAWLAEFEQRAHAIL